MSKTCRATKCGKPETGEHPSPLQFKQGCGLVCCVALPCLFDLACFFLSSFSSLIQNLYMYVCVKVDCIEMVRPIVEELKTLECDGVVVYDALLRKEVLVVTPILCFICDNPRASEITNNLGPGSRMFCRMCMVSITLGVHITCHLYSLLLFNRWTGMLIQHASGSLDQSS